MIESASTRLSLLSSSASRIRSPANPFLVPPSCPRARKFTLQIFRESRNKGGALFSNFPSLKFFIFQFGTYAIDREFCSREWKNIFEQF